MYVLATCRATILRPTTFTDGGGDTRSSYNQIATGVTAAVQETSNRYFDKATQTPRTIRGFTGSFPSGTDLLEGDRVRDDTHGVTYLVTNTTLNHAPGHQPDLAVTLKVVS